jgi:hypothetical protein
MVEIAMVLSAERDGELVTDFATEGLGLREPDVVRVAGLGTAQEAGLRGNVPEVILVANPLWLLQDQGALVDRGARLRFRERGIWGNQMARRPLRYAVFDRSLTGRRLVRLRYRPFQRPA